MNSSRRATRYAAETAHVVECVGNAPTIGLHVYGGDIFELPRRMWHP
jgi:hypothetical protein